MFNVDTAQEKFLLHNLDKTYKMLEYGSGESTKFLAQYVDTLVSVEHDTNWYNKVKEDLPDNVIYLHQPPTKPYDSREDGTYEQFEDYIKAPKEYGPFDIVFIDGRARAECCRFIFNNAAKEDTKFFIHDFVYPNPPDDRRSYLDVLEYLDIIDSVGYMYMFKRKIK